MGRVATKVGVATASLYNYFRDKNELLQYTYSRMVEPFFKKAEEAAAATMPAGQKFAQILQTALDFAVANKGLLKLLAGMGYEPEMKRACRPRFERLLNTVFEQGIQEGSFRPFDPKDLTRMFHGFLSELFDLLSNDAPASDAERFAGVLIEAALNGVHVVRNSTFHAENTHSTNP